MSLKFLLSEHILCCGILSVTYYGRQQQKCCWINVVLDDDWAIIRAADCTLVIMEIEADEESLAEPPTAPSWLRRLRLTRSHQQSRRLHSDDYGDWGWRGAISRAADCTLMTMEIEAKEESSAEPPTALWWLWRLRLTKSHQLSRQLYTDDSGEESDERLSAEPPTVYWWWWRGVWWQWRGVWWEIVSTAADCKPGLKESKSIQILPGAPPQRSPRSSPLLSSPHPWQFFPNHR